MFGIYRYGLAFCVAISHLWAGMFGGPAAYAVWGFYCLSGYLMTLILNEKYGFTAQGVTTFAINRVLRIYPAYFAVCAGMLIIFLMIPQTASHFLPVLRKPVNLAGWFFSMTLLTPPGTGELVHGAAALRVELWFYVMMALGLASNKPVVVAWFVASCCFSGWQVYSNVPFAERYVLIASCSVAFSFGALIYHFRDRLPVIVKPWPAVVAALLWWGHVWLSWSFPGGPWIFGLYTSLIFSAIAMVALMRVEPRQMPAWLRKLDRLAGNLSYPIYLSHWGVAIVLTWIFPALTRESFLVFAIGFPLVNVVAYAIYKIIEEPIQSWKLPSRLGRQAPAFASGYAMHAPHGPAAIITPARTNFAGPQTTQVSTYSDVN
jgi:peptidoglycan/LPS O-acetylase OafA/YrhL